MLGNIIQRVEGKSKLYISPDGLYNQINLYTLIDESGRYLFDRFSIKLLSNPGNLIRAKTGDFSAAGFRNAVLFGYPNYKLNPEIQAELSRNYQSKTKIDFGNLSDADNMSAVKITDLIGTKIEIEQIEKILTGNSINVSKHLQNDALEEAIKVVDSPDILHIATHGFFINDKASATQKGEMIRSEKQKRNPLLKSGLLLAGATRGLTGKTPEEYSLLDDGILTAFEAMSLKLDSTKLVVLSACETGLGLAENSDGIAGLQRAFQVSGARIIIMSLWKVSDEVTKELMTAFYTNLFEAESVSSAFRSAQAVIKNKYQNPDYWGAFVLIAY
ncbi:MAG: CHAT domain-containing protein [Ignavibacteriaceae bacterium]|nr:CHAT domain-containing protein [Ignavibacteriaceae bacterium]